MPVRLSHVRFAISILFVSPFLLLPSSFLSFLSLLSLLCHHHSLIFLVFIYFIIVKHIPDNQAYLFFQFTYKNLTTDLGIIFLRAGRQQLPYSDKLIQCIPCRFSRLSNRSRFSIASPSKPLRPPILTDYPRLPEYVYDFNVESRYSIRSCLSHERHFLEDTWRLLF
jgi:hypothetical protein